LRLVDHWCVWRSDDCKTSITGSTPVAASKLLSCKETLCVIAGYLLLKPLHALPFRLVRPPGGPRSISARRIHWDDVNGGGTAAMMGFSDEEER
jgi:hypothetical protein